MAIASLERPRLWVLQFGPCWCRVEPSDEGSFDFVRFRTAEVGPESLDRDILIVSRRVIVGSGQMLRQVHERVPRPNLVVATGHCPATHRFWEDLPGGWTPVADLLSVDLVVDHCFSGYPELTLAAILGHPRAGSRAGHETTEAAVESVRS